MKQIKLTGRFAAALLSVLLITGCSGEQHIISYESGSAADGVEASPVIPKSSIKAALLLPDDPADGACMSAAHAAAFEAVTDEMGIAASVIADADPDSTKDLLTDANVVFGAGYDFMNPLDEMAKNNPGQLYACFGGYKYNSTNYVNYYTAIYEAQYLAGIAAGTNSESGKIGIISEYSSEYPDNAAEINSFALGARAADPDAEIIVRSLGSRTDTERAEEFTYALIAEGCDVISIQCDTSTPVTAAEKKNVKFIGYGIDMASESETACLTSVVWDLKAYYKAALSAASDGTWAASGYYGTLSDEAVQLTPLAEGAASVTQARIDSAAELIKGNLLEIFSNRKVKFDPDGNASVSNSALVDNRQNIMISEDASAYFVYSGEDLVSIDPASVTSDKLASATMNYLVEGVTVRQ